MLEVSRWFGACLMAAITLAAACDPQPALMAPRPDAGASQDGGSASGPFTVVVLPDTQYYAAAYPSLFDAQASWIVANKQALNIAFVVHEGDIVDADVVGQWQVASGSL